MVSVGLQVLALALAFCGVAGVLAATLLPSWLVSLDAGAGVITAVARLQGLWVECARASTGLLGCSLRRSVLALPAHVQAARGAMALACALAAAGLCAAAAGLPCVRLGGDRESKGRAALAGALCLLAAGAAALVPSVWYTREVVANFRDPAVPQSNKLEPGGALYTAFLAAALLLLAGALFCALWRRSGPEAWGPQRPPAARPQGSSAGRLQDYV